MNTQDRIAAAIIGGFGALIIIVGSILPAYNPHEFGTLQENTLVQDSWGIYPLLGLLIAWRVYRTFTSREKPFWVMFPALWTGGWVVYDAATTQYGTIEDPFTPGPGIGCYVVGFGALMALGAGVALWRIRPDTPVASTRAHVPTPKAHADVLRDTGRVIK